VGGIFSVGVEEPYRVLIFPNIAALSDAQCGQIRD
jgi:hypothetical protein